MARIRSVDFLPEIFQTPTNKKFLNSTLDQLIQEPKLKQTQGYIGRRNAPGKAPTDGYVLEPTLQREQYQLEPGVIFKDDNGNTVDALTYVGLLDGLATAGANVDNHDRLFSSETYSWSPFIDFDKIVNYSQYYWLPDGPSSVNVAAANVFLTNDFAVTQNDNTYSIQSFPDENPAITLLRAGEYNFEVNQLDAPFYIQSQPGVDGTMSWADNISSREVLGVTNNGEDVGTVTFSVPVADAQDFYHGLPIIGNVDIATNERMDAIADQELADVALLLEIQDLDTKTLVFLDNTPGDATTLGWINNGLPVINQADRYQVYRIQIEDVLGTDYVRLVSHQLIAVNDRFTVLYGNQYSNVDFFKDATGYFAQVPLETASLDTLYYQDSTNPNRFGVINIVDQESAAVLDVSEIVGKETYTSPNGVVFTSGLKVKFRGEVTPVEYTDKEYYVEGVGTAIRLVLTTDLHVPEKFAVGFPAPWDIVGWDTEGMDNTLNAPVDQDYIIINRASLDTNAWARSNRWFHIDVLEATAEYNYSTLELDHTNRASRPIIEFEPDLRLFNYGTHSKKLIDVIDFDETDAMSNVVGAEEHIIDSFPLYHGARVIFANDSDSTVRDKIYTVQFIDTDNDGINTINLVLADDADCEEDDIVLLNNGLTMQGTVFTYSGTEWFVSQAKETVNQPPLFAMFDVDGNSLNDFVAYPSTTFAGTKLFSYAEGTGSNDPVLGFPIRYLNIDNLGDIVFENNLYTDTFLYVEDNASKENTPINTSTPRKYSSRTEFTREFGWTKSIEVSHQAQIFDVVYANEPITLDIVPALDLLIPAVSITANGTFVEPTEYTVTANVITFNSVVDEAAELQIKVISDDTSKIGYYEVASNLSSNIFNENTSLLTLGTIRNHYNNLAKNILEFEGNINGSNNIRDLGDVSEYGTLIVQQSAPVALAAMFLRNKEYNFFSSVEFASTQYEKFKNQLLNWVENHDVYDMSLSEIIDAAIKDINIGKTIDSAYYWSDMLPTGEDYETTTYTVTAISTDTYTTLNAYDFLNANTQAMLVYHNDTLLLKDLDYTVATDGPRITLLIDVVVDDVITINEYNTTLGANVPSTPTKLGLFPKFRPLIFTDDTYVEPVDVIRGHDGSITTSFGKNSEGENDIRDLVLLEFEKRVYNNIKVTEDLPIEPSDIIPGTFRETDYTSEEVTAILSQSLLSWVGQNRIDYKKQAFDQGEEKTWNYGSATSKLDGEPLVTANWRGIYITCYDTDAPHERPWEMVGLTERPIWWEPYYGTAPYTSGNLVLWDDMEAGLIREPGNERVIEKYKRPGLTTILPVDTEGNLAMPLQSIISGYSQYDFKQSWKIGDIAPAEAAWRKSSAWPFAVQRLYALTKPARYFSLMADRDRYVYNTTAEQYLYDGSSRIDSRNIEIAADTLVKHSYINWIIDYNRHFGYESVDQLKTELSNLDVNLCHHMASFTDKNNLKIFTDKSSPDSTNSSLLLPDESFNLLLYKNQPVEEIIYSSIVVQKVADGYAVIGNSFTDPYFKIQSAVDTGKFETINVGRTSNTSTSVRIPVDFADNVEYIPYGHVFSSKQAVSEFIVSYNEYLIRAGLKFDTYEKDNPVNWTQMVQEFIYWADQGWAVDSIVNLNPAATQLEFERELHIVDDLNNLELTEQPLNQNRQPLDISDYVVDRIDNNFKLRMIDGNIISYLKFNLTSFEHLLVLDNTSIFNDLIYDPVTGVRQHRVKLSGFTTYEWNGQLDAQGFLYNEDNVQEWAPVNTYNKGDIIKFKNVYWSAAEKVQPSETFDFSQWVKTDYNKINKGLLPNLATKSDQMLRYYNNKTANLESDIDLLAYGLTGFRSRDYLRSLDLDDISQVNIYGDMIENKGTVNSLNLFKGVTLNNEEVDYTIYENWAIRRARYGATSNRNYVELRLNEDLLSSNPSLVEVVNSQTDVSVANQLIPVAEIYKQSVKNTSTDIFPVRTSTNPDTALPSAGFVNPDDVDLSVFDISELSVATGVEEGTLIWVAKDTATNWNVYNTVKLDSIIIKVNDNLDGTLTLETNIPHNVLIGSTIVVDEVDALVDGTHTVLSVSNSVNITIAGTLAQNQTCVLDKAGGLLEFKSARVNVPSDIAGSIFDNKVNMTQTVWVSNDSGHPATYKKINPFSLTKSAENPTATPTEFGYSVAQGYEGAGLLVGEPGANTTHIYNKDGTGYTLTESIANTNPGIKRHGHAVALQNSWGAIAAPGDVSNAGVVAIVSRSKALGQTSEVQLLTSPTMSADDGFGSSIAMSHDENWIYVGEPKINQVHAYQKVDYQLQGVNYIADGISNTHDISESIIVDTAAELLVIVDNVVKTHTVDYTFNGTEVELAIVPAAGVKVEISRKDAEVYSGDNIEDTFAVSDLYAFDGAESIAVTVDNVLQIPTVDYNLVVSDIVFVTPPADTTPGNISISITSFRYAGTIDETTVDETFTPGIEDFGAAIDVSANGSNVAITAPGKDSDTGAAYMIDRVTERFVISDANDLTYSTVRTPSGSVFNNGHQLITAGLNVNPDYSIAGNDITLEADVVAIGDFLDVDTAEFKLIQKVEAATPTVGATFGNAVTICKSKCSVYFGAENDLSGQGSVTRYINGSRMFGSITSTIQNPTITGTTSIRVNNVEVEFPAGSSVDNIANAINGTTIPNVTATSTNGYLTIELVNKEIQSLANKLDVLPGEGTTLVELGLASYYVGQTITSPTETVQEQRFGQSLTIDLNLNQLVVSAPYGNVNNQNAPVADSTLVSGDSTEITADIITNTGVVYTYDLLNDGDTFTGGKLALGQQVFVNNVSPGDTFGNAVSLVDGTLVVGSVNYNSAIGRIAIFGNATNSLSWTATTVQNDTVDVDLINSVYIYDNDTLGVSRYLDYIDPLNGKILGVAKQNIDMITVYDPSVYNNSHNGLLWGSEQVDTIWWDISNVRFIDYNLGDARLSSKLWGKVFNGSSIDVYQWIESDVPPAEYNGTGTIYNADKFVTIAEIDRSGTIQNTYYYWVNNVETISVNSEKTLSAAAIASYIESPASSGISYAAFIASNTVALYNCKDIISNTTSVLHTEYDQTKNSNNVFVEYDLFRENHPTDFLSDSLYKKLQDSLCGVDDLGNLVPDVGLSYPERFGIEFRPRKSMFVDRYAALTSYMLKVNGILAKYTIAESRAYPLLDSEEAAPGATSGEWDQKVFSNEELSFQDLTLVPVGHKYLVESDETKDGLWTIYEVIEEVTLARSLLLKDTQGFDTKRFWNLAHWYATDFNPFTKIDYVVNEVSGLTTLVNVETNAVAKVLSNSIGSWEIHQLTDGTWNRVGLENGTIQIDDRLWDYNAGRYGFDVEVYSAQNFDEEPVAELRQIIRSINEELLIDDLSVERSAVILSVFNYVLAEQPQVDWLHKTSMIDVTQQVRSLSQYAVYQKDNQDYLIDYIKEAKPYHTKVKDFLLSYDGIDQVNGQVTDFDCPSTYSEEFGQYISPILDDGAVLVTDPSNKLVDDEVWQTEPWKQWYDNHTLSIDEVVINNPGTGYTIAPKVVVTGISTTPAEMTAFIGPGGTIATVTIDNPGSGYLETPVITFEGGNGIEAVASARMENTLVRTFLTTMKYDRYEYVSKVVDFADNDVTTTRNLVFRYTGTLQDGAIPTLYRVVELYDTEVDDNDTFIASKLEEVPYFETEDGTRVYDSPSADVTTITSDNNAITVDANIKGLDAIERKYLKEGVARWYELEDEFGAPSGVWFNENNNSESRNFVRFNDAVYRMIAFTDTTDFLASKYEVIEIETLSGVDRTSGHYVSDVNNPGLDLSLLINGIAYPGVQVEANGFDITEENLDTIYESSFLDTYLGTSPTDINVDGSEFIDTLHSHAPEELVPCSIFDTLDIKVCSRPGSDYLTDGHAFDMGSVVYTATGATETFSFENTVAHPIKVLVANVTTGKMLYDSIDFTVDWATMNVNITAGITAGDDVKVYVYEIGGGNQLNRTAIYGTDIAGATFIVPVRNSEIYEAIVFVNGVETAVTTAHVDSQSATVTLPSPVVDTDFVTATIMGMAIPQHEESYPATQTFIEGSTLPDIGAQASGKYRENAIVSVNGLRSRPPEGARYIGDGINATYLMPLYGDIIFDTVADSEVTVYVNGESLVLGVDFTVSPPGAPISTFGSSYFGTATFNSASTTNIPRWVTLITPPADGDVVNVYIRTAADYWWTGTEVIFNTALAPGDLIAVTTYKDDTELDILTQVFKGPTVIASATVDHFDSSGYDEFEYDFSTGIDSFVNVFELTRTIENVDSLWVTVNGERIHAGTGYQVINDNQLFLIIPVISSTDVVAVTSITDNVITDGVEFRLFKDMRDNVGMYKVADSTTYLTQDLADTDDIIYVTNASVLGEPNLAIAQFGILIINGERITYRERDTVANTVSGLRRGTAGTGTAPLHAASTAVYDVSSKSLVPWDYDKIWYEAGTGTASNGAPLQDQETIPAVFIKK